MVKKFVDELRSSGYSIYEMQHAYRINGVVDIYKSGTCVYDKVNHKYHKFNSPELAINLTQDLCRNHKPAENFKKAKHGITYKEFKNNKRFNPAQFYERLDLLLNEHHAEDYHWKLNETTGEYDMYIIFHRDTAKIGKSKDVIKRVKELQTALSHEVTVYRFAGKGHMENTMHKIFKEFKLNREWFRSDHRIKRFARVYGELIIKQTI
jgi:hypothetical protein